MDLGSFEVDREVRRNTEAALDVFRSLGATVEEVDLGWKGEILEAAMDYLRHIFGASVAPLLKKHGKDLTTYARQFAEQGRKSTSASFLHSLEVAGGMYQTLGPILETYNVLVCPTAALPAVPADFDHSKDTVKINGKVVSPFLGWVMTTPFNMMSRCPVLTVPSGRARNGVPTGIQIVGRTYCDADVFRAAMAFETAAGRWFDSADRRPAL
jgi:amidase